MLVLDQFDYIHINLMQYLYGVYKVEYVVETCF